MNFLEPIFTYIGELCAKVYFRVAAMSIFLITFFRWVLNTIEHSMDRIFAQFERMNAEGTGALDQLINGTGGNAGAKLAGIEVIAVINTFVPVEEALAYFSAVFTLWALVQLVRWVKSFIPTMAG